MSRWAEALTTEDPETRDHPDQAANVRGDRRLNTSWRTERQIERRRISTRRYRQLFERPRATRAGPNAAAARRASGLTRGIWGLKNRKNSHYEVSRRSAAVTAITR